MGTILVLAVAAAVYPQLLAVVVVILTRPNPKPLLWACYLGALLVSVGTSVAIVAIFRSRETIAGSSSSSVGSAPYLVVGAIALAVSVLVLATRGRVLASRDRFGLRSRRERRSRGPSAAARMRSRAESALQEGSLVIAVAIGGLLAIPGPFDVAALGHLARNGYGPVETGVLIVVFALIKFVLIEAPIAGYAINPDGTAARVHRFSAWMKANKLAVVAVVIGLLGLALIGRGLS